MKRTLALLFPLLLLPGCFTTRATVNQQLSAEAAAEISAGTTAAEVVELLEGSGLTDIVFSDGPPWWVAVGRRSANLVAGS